MEWKKFRFALFFEQFLIKGWEIGILLLLPILKIKGDISLFELGFLSTTLSLSQLVTSMLSGKIIRKWGNDNMMMISAVLGIFPWLVLGLKPGMVWLFFLYVSAGMSSGLFETGGISLMAKSMAHGKRSEGLGNLAMAGDAGRILLTAATTILVATWGLFSFSLINALMGIMLLTVLGLSLEKKYFSNVTEISNPEPYRIAESFKDRNFVLSLVVGWLDSFSSASLFIFLPLLFDFKGLPYNESGLLSILLFVGYMIGRKVLGRIADRFGTIKTLMIGETMMAAIILAIVIIDNLIILIILLLLLGITTRGTSPVCKAMAADSLPENLSMENGVSLYQSGARLANIISRPIFSGIVGLAGVSAVFIVSAVSGLAINIPLRAKDKI